MASKDRRPEPARRPSWLSKAKYGGRDAAVSPVVEGQAMHFARSPAQPLSADVDGSAVSETSTPALSRRNSNALTRDEPDTQASQLILNALQRAAAITPKPKTPRSSFSTPAPPPPPPPASAPPTTTTAHSAAAPAAARPAISKMSFSSMMGGLSLSLTRSTDDRERGRSQSKDRSKRRASSLATNHDGSTESVGGPAGRARSQSPFHFRRARREREREPSPDTIEALTQSDAESDAESIGRGVRPRNIAYGAGGGGGDGDDDSGDETEMDDEDDEDDEDPLTASNTERNALVPAAAAEAESLDPDPLGEGVNVVIPPEPYFPTTLNAGPGRLRRRKTKTLHDPLPIQTARPAFQRDRCTIAIRHGHPEEAAEESGGRVRTYVVASDLSEESRYAVEWGIGTVLRDGDEMLIVHVTEDESKIDPDIPNAADRARKVRSQQERQAIAYILIRQATSLLQRTKLNVTIRCQAWHAKNARHMLLDIVDFFDPTMLIVGSRGLGQLKGILLGSTSHYLLQKCSVPVMVARRRLKRPPKRAAHLAPHRPRTSLANANIDTVASRVDQDVAHMREEVGRDEDSRHEPGGGGVVEEDDEDEDAPDGDEPRKVAGE